MRWIFILLAFIITAYQYGLYYGLSQLSPIHFILIPNYPVTLTVTISITTIIITPYPITFTVAYAIIDHSSCTTRYYSFFYIWLTILQKKADWPYGHVCLLDHVFGIFIFQLNFVFVIFVWYCFEIILVHFSIIYRILIVIWFVPD